MVDDGERGMMERFFGPCPWTAFWNVLFLAAILMIPCSLLTASNLVNVSISLALSATCWVIWRPR
jgi:hypothetical protein